MTMGPEMTIGFTDGAFSCKIPEAGHVLFVIAKGDRGCLD